MAVPSIGSRSGRRHSRRSRSRSESVLEQEAEDASGQSGSTLAPWKAWAELLAALFAGFVFAAGLVLGGMTQPSKVLAFLDIKEMAAGPFPGNWDPSLAFVMGGAVMVTLLAFFATPRASVRPWFTRAFVLPRRDAIDTRLVFGAILFGIGWGLSGYCPGPAMATLLVGQMDTVMFVMAMLPGMWIARKI